MTVILYAVPSPVVPVIFAAIAGLRACLILKERSGDVDLALNVAFAPLSTHCYRSKQTGTWLRQVAGLDLANMALTIRLLIG